MTASPPPHVRKLAFLGNHRIYPHRPAHVRIIETHFAWVFLAGRYVFKLKKPARYAGMNYRTLAARGAKLPEFLSKSTDFTRLL